MNKKYCVYNKQYTKEEYERIIPDVQDNFDAKLFENIKEQHGVMNIVNVGSENVT